MQHLEWRKTKQGEVPSASISPFCDQEDLQSIGHMYGKNLKQFNLELTPLSPRRKISSPCLNSRDAAVQLHSVHLTQLFVPRRF